MIKKSGGAAGAVMGCFLLLALGVVTATAQGSLGGTLRVMGGGGGRCAGDGVILSDTLGEPIIGCCAGNTLSLRAGFWQAGRARMRSVPVGGVSMTAARADALFLWLGLAVVCGGVLAGLAIAVGHCVRRLDGD